MHLRLLATIGAQLCGLIIVTSCGDAGAPSQLTPANHAARQLTHEDSVTRGYFAPRASLARMHGMSVGSMKRDLIGDATVSLVGWSPSNFQGYAQPSTITGEVSGPVASITVYGEGAILCSGDYGNLNAYDQSGALLASVPLQLIDESDCSPPENPDNVTYGATATLTVPYGVIARFEITPMNPLRFLVYDQCCGRASQNYYVTLGAGSPPPAKLAISPTTLTVDPFQIGHFTASAPGATVTGIQWSMIDVKGNISSCPSGALTCDILVKRDGILTVTASVNGLLQQASADVTVTKVPCPTGDTLVDLPQVRNLLKQAWLDSKPTDKMENRLERQFWLLRDPATGVLTTVPAYASNATPCSGTPTLPANSPPLVVVAGFHTHPFTDLEALPANCPQTGKLGYSYDAKKWGGPSEADWNYANTGDGQPIYVADKDNIYRAIPISPVTPQNAVKHVEKHTFPAQCRN